MTFKEQVLKLSIAILNNKIKPLRQTLNDLKESAANETKSTAGDKHETALAMLQIEQKNTSQQLENLLSQKMVLDKILPAIAPIYITTGALVSTNNGCFFISIPLGKVIVDNVTVVVLSPHSPLGSQLMRLRGGESTIFNGVTYVVEQIE